MCPDISQATVENTLNSLVKEGYVLKVGVGKNIAYIRNSETIYVLKLCFIQLC